MKILFLSLAVVLTISSCSPKYTASFPNYDQSYGVANQHILHETEPISTKEETQEISPTKELPKEMILASSSNSPVDFGTEQVNVNSTKLISVGKEERKSILKQIRSESKLSQNEPKNERPGNEKKNIFAMIGFFSSLTAMTLGIAIPPLFVLIIPGIILSVIGLWSKKKAWAIAGTIIGILGIVLSVILLASWG